MHQDQQPQEDNHSITLYTIQRQQL